MFRYPIITCKWQSHVGLFDDPASLSLMQEDQPSSWAYPRPTPGDQARYWFLNDIHHLNANLSSIQVDTRTCSFTMHFTGFSLKLHWWLIIPSEEKNPDVFFFFFNGCWTRDVWVFSNVKQSYSTQLMFSEDYTSVFFEHRRLNFFRVVVVPSCKNSKSFWVVYKTSTILP